MPARSLLGALLAISLIAPAARAQQWRTVDAARQRQGADSVLHVEIDYGAGKMSLTAAHPPLLYDVRLRYDADRFTPTRQFDAEARELSIGLKRAGATELSLVSSLDDGRNHVGRHNDANELTVALAPKLPLDLRLDLGAVEARLDLSNLWLDRLRLRSGASDVRLTFGTPNPRRLRMLEVLGGAASIGITGLGNANVELLQIRAAAASVDLDFSGTWAGDMRVELDAALGEATLRIPPDVGVRLTMTKLLADLQATGLTKRDGAYYSGNWDRAARKLSIEAHSALGDLTVQRIEP